MPFVAAAAWYTCDTTLLDLLGGVLALGAGTLFPRHMARTFGVALVCAHCARSITPSALAARLRPLDAVFVCRLLAVFLVHAGIIFFVQTQFNPGPLFLDRRKFFPGVSYGLCFHNFLGVAHRTPWFKAATCLHWLILPHLNSVTEGGL